MFGLSVNITRMEFKVNLMSDYFGKNLSVNITRMEFKDGALSREVREAIRCKYNQNGI